MADSWKISAFAPKSVVHDALLAHDEALDWEPEVVLSGREVDKDRPEDWILEAWLSRPPGDAELAMVAVLFDHGTPELTIEKLPDEDWITISQQGVEPIRAGKFYIHTPDHQADTRPGTVNFCIPASQAFGTGQHETTAGCLAMLDEMKQSGLVARSIADIGTGTGLLAFAAMHLWPHARATATDIDPVCVDVVDHNAKGNFVSMGAGQGELTMIVADGMDNALLQARGPYDLLIANILAGPLIDLAPDFGASVPAGGNLLLAGLLETQEKKVRRACFRAGFRLARRRVHGDWSILWLRKRPGT